jgi:hypothetical protein
MLRAWESFMLGKRAPQNELFDVGNVFPFELPPRSFHGQLARVAGRLFTDESFAEIYSEKMGRPSVPPSQLALVVVMQTEANVSDREAIARTACDLRWAAVLGRAAGEPLCARSTLELFRAHLIIHKEINKIFETSISEAKRAGLLADKELRAAVDTKPIQSRGAVLDTCNLLATGIRQLSKALCGAGGKRQSRWMREHGLARYTEPSIKGSADIDWSDEKSINSFIEGIVADAKRLIAMVTISDEDTLKAAELLSKLLLQDIEQTPSETGEAQVQVKKGTAHNRIPSATDPEQRHGRKSKSKRFVGSKASIAVDIESQVIVATDVIPGNAGDATGVLSLIEQAEANTGQKIEETIGDCAYGGGETRQSFVEAERTLTAKVPKEHDNGGLFPKSSFAIDLETNTVICPAGNTCSQYVQFQNGRKVFYFGIVCSTCSLQTKCTSAGGGRSVSIHPQEGLLQEARAYQETAEGRQHMRERCVIEHRLARLGQLGIGQARYIGIQKTKFQLGIASAVANFRLVWNWQQSQSDSSEGTGAALGILQAAYAYLSALLRPHIAYLRPWRPYSVVKVVAQAA